MLGVKRVGSGGGQSMGGRDQGGRVGVKEMVG